MKRIIVILCLSLLSTAYLPAQIMNIERLRLDSDSGWAGTARGAYSLSKSNRKVTQLQSNVHVQYRQDIHTLLMVSDLTFIRAGDENFENRASQHFRYTRSLNNWLSVEGFAQFQYNQVMKIKFRNLWGGGLRFEAFDRENFKWYIGNIVMYEHEQYASNEIANVMRLSYFINIMWKKEDAVSLSSIVYLQPKMFNIPQYRINWQSSIDFKVLDNLRAGVRYSWMTDTDPPEGVSKVTYSLQNTLSYSF